MTAPVTDGDLTAWVDGELAPREAERVAVAVRDDPTLRARAEEIREARRWMREHALVRAPTGFAARVMDAVEAEDAPQDVESPWRRPFGVPWQGLALAAATVWLLWAALPAQPEPEVAAAAADDAPTVTLASGSEFLAPAGWRLSQPVSEDWMVATAEALGGEVARDGEAYILLIPKQQVARARLALQEFAGPLEPLLGTGAPADDDRFRIRVEPARR